MDKVTVVCCDINKGLYNI